MVMTSAGMERTRIGVIGCGYVFDHYMATWARHPELELVGVADLDRARAERVGAHYGLRIFASNEEMLADSRIDIVANFTSIESHFEVTRQALLAGKHVYSEKPLTPDFEDAKVLVALAAERGLALSCAPSNALGDTTQTMWKAVRDGAVGDVRIVYAEFDDNPIYLMSPEGWRSRTGAPWPYVHEYEQGCTFEHVGYHLTWLCSIFGPVESVTAFSKVAIPDKTEVAMRLTDTPDFSVACLNFHSGVVARVTCSIGAPYDHRMRIIGNKGMLTADTYRSYRCPVYYEPFTKLSLNARKATSVRRHGFLRAVFGVGGRRLKLVRNANPGSLTRPQEPPLRWWSLRALLTYFKGRELGVQDKVIGLAELAAALRERRAYFPAPDFTLHLTELTIAIQGAGVHGASHVMRTSFEAVKPRPQTLSGPSYTPPTRPPLLDRLAARIIEKMHRH
jgi:predicted dehydrogenase